MDSLRRRLQVDAAGRPAARPHSLSVRRAGRLEYAAGLGLQERIAAAVESGAPDSLLLVEHPPVVTLGRGTMREHLLVSATELRRRGIAVAETDRGGDVTYHGPGQIVGYPIVDLRRRGVSVRGFLRLLEGVLIDALGACGVEARRRSGLTGVWTSSGKVAAIGISVRRGVTRHGFALNVDADLAPFELIVPCGLPEPVTSMAALGWRGRRTDLEGEIVTRLEEALAAAAGGRP